MDRFLPELSAVDWAFIASVIILASLLVFGTYAIRSEVRETKRVAAKSVKLKTSKVQRQRTLLSFAIADAVLCWS